MDEGRRKHVRVPARVPCDVLAQARQLPAVLVDLSLGGAMVELDAQEWPPVGSTLDVTLQLNGQSMTLASVVVRRAGEGKFGVAFQGLGRVSEAALARFVQQQERKLLRTHLHLQ